MDARLIAPCGMNCAICAAYLRTKNRCPGCRAPTAGQPVTRRRCIVKNCETVLAAASGFCGECADFPCRRVRQLDARYVAKYRMSMIGNLLMIKERGMAAFLAREAEKWRCPDCGDVISCHNGRCYACGAEHPEKTGPLP